MKSKMVALVAFLTVAFFAAFNFPSIDSLSNGEQEAKGDAAEFPSQSMFRAPLDSAVELFVAGDGEDAPWTGNTPAAHRVRVVIPDPDLLTSPPVLKKGDRLVLPLFNDAVLESIVGDVTVYPNGSVGMTAQLEGDFKGVVYLAYSGGELRVSAEVLGGNDFYVRYVPERRAHVAIEVDRAASDYRSECDACKSPPAEFLADGASAAAPAEESGIPSISADAPEDRVEIDVMVVYTPAALGYEGSTNAINNNISLAMQRANDVHGNSDTKVILNLIHSEKVDYTEAEMADPVNGNPFDDLMNLTFTGGTNSAMDNVQILRDAYGADLVCLYEDTDMVGGMGWLLNTANGLPDYAYCLARVRQSDWSYTVVHEWGHNMGCSHSKTQALGPWEPGDLFSYSAGWQWADSASSATEGYCSIMTYEDFNDDGIDEYDRVAYFSNPSIDYIGNGANATGDSADGDNARTIRSMRRVVADYRFSNADIDGDGLPNAWEIEYFGGSTNALWSGNPDDDAYNNLEEYIAGLNPKVPDDFGPTNLTASAINAFEWNAVSGRLYRVYWSSNLFHGFSVLESNLTSGIFTDSRHSAERQGFYRLEVELAP